MAWLWTGQRERRTTLAASGVALLGCRRHGRAAAVGSGRLLGNFAGAADDDPDLGHDGRDPPPSRRLHAAGGGAVGLPVRASSSGRWPIAATRHGLATSSTSSCSARRSSASACFCSPSARGSISATRSALIGALETPLAPAIGLARPRARVPALLTCVGGAIVLAAVVGDLAGHQGEAAMSAEQRVKELALDLPPPPKAAGNYVPARAGRQPAVSCRAAGRSAPTAAMSSARLGADMNVAAGLCGGAGGRPCHAGAPPPGAWARSIAWRASSRRWAWSMPRPTSPNSPR